MEVIKLTEAGEKMGYTGESLRQFLDKEIKMAAEKERQQIEREERAREREERAKIEEHKRELEKKEIERQQKEEERKEKEEVHKRDLEKQEIERQQKEEERKEKKEAHKRDLEKQEKERERLRKDKEEEHRRELEKRDKDMEMIKLKMTTGKDQAEGVTQNVTMHRPKLPKFEEDKDDMDTYLQRFERFAKMQKWKPEEWVMSLSPLLTGKGLEVYASMPDTDLDNYDQLKLALLKRYQLTEEGFRKRFRESKSEKGETVYQFVARLSRYFRRWVELSGINKTYDGLEDFMVREQYLSTCGQDLTIFLRERIPKDTKEMTRLAEQYIEARGVEYGSDSNSKTAAAAFPVRSPSYGEKQCYICHRTNHIARDCFYKEQHPRYSSNAGGEYSQSNRVQCRE